MAKFPDPYDESLLANYVFDMYSKNYVTWRQSQCIRTQANNETQMITP